MSILYAYFERKSGPYMKCSLYIDDLCFENVETRRFLLKGCEYHSKNVTLSWIEVGIYTFSILLYPLQYILTCLFKIGRDRLLNYRKRKWERSRRGGYRVIIHDEETANFKDPKVITK